jgi:hypothetical protein
MGAGGRRTGWRGCAGAALPALAVACVAVTCVALWLANADTAAASVWSIQRTPNPGGATDSALSGVSCTSPTACTAVGHFTDAVGAGVPLAERWNGTNWTVQRTPRRAGATSSLLFDVSCASPRSCTAVGSFIKQSGSAVPLVERWNGTRWSIQSTPNPSRANGGRVSYLGGVSCASATTCTAVGHSGNSSGTSGGTLTEGWNGAGWTIQRTPHPPDATASFLSAVSCVSPRSCTAVGFTNRASGGKTLAERWNGAGWAIQRTPTPAAAANVQLVGISCASARTCTAVGYFTVVTGIDVMLAERWNGTGWAIQRTLYPAGARYVQLAGVACATPSSCTAVGLSNNTPGIDVTLAERSKNRNWAIQPTPNPHGATNNTLQSVSCPSPSRCIAVGGFDDRAGVGETLAQRYS